MYLSELKLWNFRKYGIKGDSFESAEPGVVIKFHNGVNVLIGENDSGKTAIVDAIRYTLKTQSGEFIQLEEKDFHQDKNGDRTTEFKIECIFDDLNDQDSGMFWEWLNVTEDTPHNYQLKVRLYAKRKDNLIIPSFSAGPIGSSEQMDGEARNLLMVVYLKPLRDAVTDMTHGYKSRFAQILGSHKVFATQKDDEGNIKKHELEIQYKDLKEKVDAYFKDDKGSDITKSINTFLTEHFLIEGDNRKAEVRLTGGELYEILRQLDLVLEGNKSGLGTLNLLCIAAEMLLLSNQTVGLKLALIEELEAHLHPQYQLRLIDYIVKNETNEQFILTTHSITLASKIQLNNLLILRNGDVYPMSSEYTQMQPGDYKFLERFLDATKSNLFFARGLILVEGDAENLLIPTIANILGCPLQKAGVSIVNVGSTAYKRYLSIFKRRDNKTIDMPIAVVSDLDIRSLEYYNDNNNYPKVWKTGDLLENFKAISPDICYENFPPYFKSWTELTGLIRNNKKDSFSMTYKVCFPKFRSLLTEDKQVPYLYTNDEILKMRIDKFNNKHIEIDDGMIKIFLPNAWTLEYEIASSQLYKYLYLATILASEEENHQDFTISNEIIKERWENDVLTKYPSGHSLSPNDSYEIFKPLNDGDVSKAITAQYLAAILSGDIAPTKDNQEMLDQIKNILGNNVNLSYIRDAIAHATLLH